MTDPVNPCLHVCVRCGSCPDCCPCTTGDLLAAEGFGPDLRVSAQFQRLSLAEPDEVVAERILRQAPLTWADLLGQVTDDPA